MEKAKGVRFVTPETHGGISIDAAMLVGKPTQPKSENDEREAFHQLTFFVDDNIRTSPNDRTMEMMSSILYNPRMSKGHKQAAVEALLAHDRKTLSERLENRDEPFLAYSSSFLRQSYTLDSLVVGWFHNESWYRASLRSLADKCLAAPLADQRRKAKDYTLSDAVNEDKNLMLAEEIHRIEPIDDFAARKEAVIKEIGYYVGRAVDRGYYTQMNVQHRERWHYDTIQELVMKYGIDIPSEQELFNRDVASAVQNAEERIAHVATNLIDRPADPLVRDAQQAIASLDAIVKEAEQRGHITLTFPQGYESGTSASSALQKKLLEARTAALNTSYEHALSALESRIEDAARVRNFSNALRDLVLLVYENKDVLSMQTLRSALEIVLGHVNERFQEEAALLTGDNADVGSIANRIKEYDQMKKELKKQIEKIS